MDHTLMHCCGSILRPLVFYFYSSSSQNLKKSLRALVLVFTVKKLQEALTIIQVQYDCLCSDGS